MLLPHTDYKENEGGSEGFSFKQAFNYGHSNGYGESIARLSNMLGGGVIVQRFGDLEQISQLYPLFLDTTGAVVSKLRPESGKCKKTLEILDMMR